MAAPLYIPSSGGSAGQNPESVSVITTSYTVPAGKYAKLVVNLEGSATFTVNGTTAIRGTQNSVLGSSPIQTESRGTPSVNHMLTTGTNNVGSSGAAFVSATDQKTVTTEINLPAGAVANGTGTWRALVMIFSV